MFVFELEKKPDLKGKKVYITSGKSDPHLRSKEEIENLTEYLKSCGAEVHILQTNAGHELSGQEVEIGLGN